MALAPVVATAVAAAGYRMKYGESVAIQVPVVDPSSLAKIAVYLHAMRLETLKGKVRAPWMCRQNMVASPDLLVWSCVQKQKKWMRGFSELQTYFLNMWTDFGEVRTILEECGKVPRTIVCQHSAVTLPQFIEGLRRQVSPFAVLVDASQFGSRNDLEILHQHIRSHFSDTPVLWLTAAGDLGIQFDLKGIAQDKPLPLWRAGHRDMTLWRKSERQEWDGRVVSVPDYRLNERLSLAYRDIKLLEAAIREDQKAKVSQPLMRVWKTLLSLPVPLDFYEIHADIGRRGGLVAFYPIAEMIKQSELINLGPIDIQSALIAACTSLRDVISMLLKGKSGRVQAINRWVDETLRADCSGVLVTAGQPEADILRKWLMLSYASRLESGALTVMAWSSVFDTYIAELVFDRALLIGEFWHSNLWIAGVVKDISWLAMPCEIEHIMQSSANLKDLSYTRANKDIWWDFGCDDEYEPNEDPLAVVEWGDCSGQYVNDTPFQAELPNDSDWMLNLLQLADWVMQPDEERASTAVNRDHVIIRTESQNYIFSLDDRLEVFYENSEREDKLVVAKLAREIMPGDVLLADLEIDTGERSMLDVVMEHLADNSVDIQFYKKQTETWHDYVNHASARYGGDIKKLHAQLASLGTTEQTTHNWLNRIIEIPQEVEKALELMAKLSGIDHTPQKLRIVSESMGHLKAGRIQAGKALHAVKMAIANGAKIAKVGGINLNVGFVTEILSFEKVCDIHHFVSENDGDLPKDLLSCCAREVERFDGKIVLTSAAERSLRDSPYQDIDRAVHMFGMIGDVLHRGYVDGDMFQDAIAQLTKAGIDFTPGMSEKTMGMHKKEYKRTYKGQRVDIGRHLGLGDSRNPERCFRLHYHFDEDAQAVIVHHAGRHLPTKSS